jgi:hypothetical protein
MLLKVPLKRDDWRGVGPAEEVVEDVELAGPAYYEPFGRPSTGYGRVTDGLS